MSVPMFEPRLPALSYRQECAVVMCDGSAASSPGGRRRSCSSHYRRGLPLAHLLIVTLGRVLSVTAGRDRSRDSRQTHPAGGDVRHHFGLGFLAVVGLLMALPLVAHVAPVDQIVMRGMFDQGDG